MAVAMRRQAGRRLRRPAQHSFEASLERAPWEAGDPFLMSNRASSMRSCERLSGAFQRTPMRSAILPSVPLAETRATLALAVPLATANVSQMAMSVTDTVMVGKLGAVPLAAVALGGGFYFTSVVVCLGVLTAVAPLAAYSIGAGEPQAAGRIARSGLVLAALLSLPVAAAMLFA